VRPGVVRCGLVSLARNFYLWLGLARHGEVMRGGVRLGEVWFLGWKEFFWWGSVGHGRAWLGRAR